MRANSLALRLFLSATAWIAVILLVTGIILSSIYRQLVERNFDRRLGVYLRTLVADLASPDDDEKFVLAGHPARHDPSGHPRVALAVGRQPAAAGSGRRK